MFRFLELLFPGKNRLNQELEDLQKDIEPLTHALISWNYQELELLSLIQTERSASRYSKYTQGIITSIYHEHMAAYKWKKVSGLTDLEVCYVETKSSNFQFVVKSGEPSLYINKQFLGTLKKDGTIYSTKRNVIAHINMDGSEWWEVDLQGKKLGSIVNIHRARDINPRAFFLSSDLSKEEQEIIFCIACYVIINLTKDEKKLRFQ